MDFGKVIEGIGHLAKWAPVIEVLHGMFGSPEEALERVRSWELAERAKTDERLARLRAERGES